MKKRATILLVLFFLCVPCLMGASELSKTVSAKAFCVRDADTGRILMAYNENTKLPMASTTKIMTALLIIEQFDLSKIVTVADQAQGVEGSSLYLKSGEQYSRLDLLYGLMLRSGNDAAIALAIDCAGSVESFVDKMNARAHQLGVLNTNFVNPHGLPADDHYTTAADLSLIAAYAMKNETFSKIVGSKSAVITRVDTGSKKTIWNKNKLLGDFEGALGIKTGYTKAAGRCLAGAAKRDERCVVSVVLNAPDMWEDVMNLMEQAFTVEKKAVYKKGDVIRSVTVENGEEEELALIAGEELSAMMDAEEEKRAELSYLLPEVLQAPIEQGEWIGTVVLRLDGRDLSAVPIIAEKGIEADTIKRHIKRLIHGWINTVS